MRTLNEEQKRRDRVILIISLVDSPVFDPFDLLLAMRVHLQYTLHAVSLGGKKGVITSKLWRDVEKGRNHEREDRSSFSPRRWIQEKCLFGSISESFVGRESILVR